MNPLQVAHRLPHMSARHATPWLLLGGAIASFLDLSFAAIYWTTLHDSSPGRVLQSIASWVLGTEAFTGGTRTAALGAALYTYLMCVLMAVYHAAAAHYPVLLRRPLACGALYGMGMYLLIFELIVPHFTAASTQPPPLDWTLACLLAYALLIGIPCALVARIVRN